MQQTHDTGKAWRRLLGIFGLLLLVVATITLWRLAPLPQGTAPEAPRTQKTASLAGTTALQSTTLARENAATHDSSPNTGNMHGRTQGLILPAGFMRAPSGRLLPRFATLARAQTAVRLGPATEYPVAWIIRHAGMPLEVLAEAGSWLRVRDHEGEEGWLPADALGEARHALVAPWRRNARLPLRTAPREDAPLQAWVGSGVIVRLSQCDGYWCKVQAGNREATITGWLQQAQLWGIYRHERIPATAPR